MSTSLTNQNSHEREAISQKDIFRCQCNDGIPTWYVFVSIGRISVTKQKKIFRVVHLRA